MRTLAKSFGTIFRWPILFILLAAAQTVHGQPVKIMPLGDSWTSGHGGYASYRYDLWFYLKDAGFDVDFVGDLDETYHGVLTIRYPEYLTTFDRDHSGYWGYQTHQLISIGRIGSLSHQPEIVLLWAGGNDLWNHGEAGVANARSGLREIIEDIRSVVPGITILLGQLTPYKDRGGGYVESLNSAIANLASELDSSQSPVILVDHATGFDIGSMTQDDNVHHNLAGEAWVAENWFEVLADLLPVSEPFQINAGHSGAWYNPATTGQGGFIDIDPSNQYLFLSWFTYTAGDGTNPGEQHWFTGQGNYAGDTADLVIYESIGGKFDDPQSVSTDPVGTATVAFSDCNNGQLTYDLSDWNKQGAFFIQRVVPGSENTCQDLSSISQQTVDINAGMDGSWYNPETAGQGFFLDAHEPAAGDGFLFLSWFTFGDATTSGLRWLTAQGNYTGPTAELEVFETSGGRFDDPLPPDTVKIGTATLSFDDCSNAMVAYSLPGEGKEGEIGVTRALPGTAALCEELSGVD